MKKSAFELAGGSATISRSPFGSECFDGDGVICGHFASNSFKNHPGMGLPKCDATLDTRIANPVALPQVVKCARGPETRHVSAIDVTCNTSTRENAVPTSEYNQQKSSKSLQEIPL